MDNDPKHTCMISKQWIDRNIPNKMPWSSQSLDIHPIENLFGWAKQKLVKEVPKTIAELKCMLEEDLGQHRARKFFSILEVNGNSLQYGNTEERRMY